MHLGNSIICPVTGIPIIIAMGAFTFYAFKKAEFKKDNLALTLSLSAFVFALQMINFAIPSTGSSGHIIGTILLAALLSPTIAFLAMSAILIVQSVFFADGGLMALGCNIFNMAFLPCFVVYPLLFKPFKNKPFIACLLSSVAALELGALAVVIEASLSSSLTGNIANFLSLMMLIHLPIAAIEGLFTGSIAVFMQKETFRKKSTVIFSLCALFLAGVIYQFASNKPDGLEWSLLNVSDFVVNQATTAIEAFQNKIAVLTKISPLAANLTGMGVLSLLLLSITKLKTHEQ